MSEREERRFVEIPRESVRLMAESTGVELTDEVAALLAEDVCYRLREATQVRTPGAMILNPASWRGLGCRGTPGVSVVVSLLSPPEQFAVHETY